MCDTFLSKPLTEIVKLQATLKDKKPIARSKRCLERMTENIAYRPGLVNDDVFAGIHIKVNSLLEVDRHCIICMDEMSLKANLFYHTGRDEIIGLHDIGLETKQFLVAQNASVIMARGIYYNWKQPVAYFFVHTQFKASDILPILKACITKLFDIGLHVDGVVTDMGSNFISLSTLLNVTPENPVFSVNDHDVVYLFDTCHLQKATKNNLVNNTFCFENKRTSWTFVEEFYKSDKLQPYRCAPKLTDAHIYPTNFEKMKVKYAVQVLSNSVASGMNTYDHKLFVEEFRNVI
ncbi:hypothetical protein NQ315_003696 [Exocentrus adspersus]|uniref:Transposase n=1 Tax=Exocentrus adspersus TaxID=1586481 RepID=A0AAV8V6W3_9CUCU|nr:hypothetical protein NQ315_003696 [Exocentrus adspersus]